MEVGHLVLALERTILFLRKSESSDWASLSIEEVIRQLKVELDKAGNPQSLDINRLRSLYGPTGSLQEISIDNGWGKEFIEIANIIDQFISD